MPPGATYPGPTATSSLPGHRGAPAHRVLGSWPRGAVPIQPRHQNGKPAPYPHGTASALRASTGGGRAGKCCVWMKKEGKGRLEQSVGAFWGLDLCQSSWSKNQSRKRCRVEVVSWQIQTRGQLIMVLQGCGGFQWLASYYYFFSPEKYPVWFKHNLTEGSGNTRMPSLAFSPWRAQRQSGQQRVPSGHF